MRFLCGIFVFVERFSELVMEKLFVHLLSFHTPWFLVVRNLEGPVILLQILSSSS